MTTGTAHRHTKGSNHWPAYCSKFRCSLVHPITYGSSISHALFKLCGLHHNSLKGCANSNLSVLPKIGSCHLSHFMCILYFDTVNVWLWIKFKSIFFSFLIFFGIELKEVNQLFKNHLVKSFEWIIILKVLS